MLQNIIYFSDQPTHAYLISIIDEILCFCISKAKAKQTKTTVKSFSFGNHKIHLSLKKTETIIIDIFHNCFLYCTIKSVIYEIPVGGPEFGCED